MIYHNYNYNAVILAIYVRQVIITSTVCQSTNDLITLRSQSSQTPTHPHTHIHDITRFIKIPTAPVRPHPQVSAYY